MHSDSRDDIITGAQSVKTQKPFVNGSIVCSVRYFNRASTLTISITSTRPGFAMRLITTAKLIRRAQYYSRRSLTIWKSRVNDLNRVYKHFGVGVYLRVLFSKAKSLSNLGSTALRAIGAVKSVQADGVLIKSDFGGFNYFSYERIIGPHLLLDTWLFAVFISLLDKSFHPTQTKK